MQTENELPIVPEYVDAGRRIEAAMAGKYTPPKLAAALGISPQAVGKWLRGEVLPGPTNAKALETLIGLDVGTLYGGHEPPRPGRRRPDTTRATISRPMVGVTVPDKYITPLDSETPSVYDEFLSERIALGPRSSAVRDKNVRFDRVMRERETVRGIERELLRVLAHQSAKFRSRDPINAAGECHVRGGYFDQFVDMALLRAGVPQFAVVAQSNVDGRMQSILGAAANWKAATGGKPFYFAWVITDTVRASPRFQQCREALHAMAGMSDIPFQRGLLDPDPVRPPPTFEGLFEIEADNMVRGMMDFESRMIEAISKAVQA